MLLQGKKAASFARKPDPDVWAVLAFGEDEGLASDNGQLLISAWAGKDAHADVTLLDDDAIRKEPALLFDALEAVSLLGDPRIVRVRTSGDKIAKLLIEAIEDGDKRDGRFSAHLLIEAGCLPRKSPSSAARLNRQNGQPVFSSSRMRVLISSSAPSRRSRKPGSTSTLKPCVCSSATCLGIVWLPIPKSKNWDSTPVASAGLFQ